MRKHRPHLLLALFCAALASSVAAGGPATLNYQGRMRQNVAGSPPVADSNANVAVFSLYDAATSGTLVWTESQSGITTTAGLFNVVLGVNTPLTAVPFDKPYWLNIVWNTEPMNPRQPLSSAPYAFKARGLDTPASLSHTAGESTLNLYNSSSAGRALFVQGSSDSGIPAAEIINNSANRIAVKVQGGTAAGGVGVQSSGAIGVYGQNAGVGTDAIWGSASSAGSRGGVFSGGSAGVSGSANSAGGVGVAAYQGTGAYALASHGNSVFDLGSVTFAAHVDFSGATVTGLTTPGLVAPFTLAGATSPAAFAVTQTGSGPAIQARSYAGSSVALSASAAQADAIYGLATGNGAYAGVHGNAGPAGNWGVFGELNSNAQYAAVFGKGYLASLPSTPASVGVIGATNQLNASGVWGEEQAGAGGAGVVGKGVLIGISASAGSGGVGLQGIDTAIAGVGILGVAAGSGVGVRAFNPSPSGVGLLAEDSNGAGMALNVSGNARFDGAGKTTAFYSYVSFNGGTNLGLTVPVPLTLTGVAALPGGVLTATNTGNGFGIVGAATQPGTDNGLGLSLSSPVNAGVYGYTNSSSSAGVLGKGFAGSNTAGVVGLGSTGVLGVGIGASGTGGDFTADGASALAVQGRSISGTGGSFQGVTGVVVNATGPNAALGLNVFASGPARALQVQGDAIFSGAGNTVTFSSKVVFTGGVSGVTVSAPLSLTQPAAAAALYANNTSNLGNGDGILADTLNSFGIHGRINGTSCLGCAGVYGESRLSANQAYGVLGNSDTNNLQGVGVVGTYGLPAVPANYVGGAGMLAADDAFSGIGLYASSQGNFGKAVVAKAFSVGVSATASDTTGVAIFASSNSSQPAVKALNAGGSAGIFTTSVASFPVALVGSTDPTFTGTSSGGAGVFGYASRTAGNGVHGVADGNAGAGVQGTASQASAFGVQGLMSADANGAVGVHGVAVGAASGVGVFGNHAASITFPLASMGVFGLSDRAGGAGVYGSSLNGIGVVASGATLGLSVTGGAVFYGASSTSFTGHVNFSGPVTGLGLFGPLNLSSTTGATTVFASNTSNGAGVFAKAISFTPAVLVQGAQLGLSVTATDASSDALYARSNSSTETIRAQNDNSGGFGIQGVGTGTGIGVKGTVVSAASGSAGIWGSGGSTSGVMGVLGDAAGIGSVGVSASNPSATVAGGGSALLVNGLIRVNQGSVNVNAATSITTSASTPSFRINFTSGGAVQSLIINNAFVTAGSSAMVSFNSANMPGTLAVRVVAGTITLGLSAPLTVSTGEGVNVVLIDP